MTKKHILLGQRGEELARKFLQKAGYKILESNYCGRLGEIDLVAEDGDCLVFIEVKTRASLAFGHPLESIGFRKQHQLLKVASEYLAERGKEDRFCRFDAVSVLQTGDLAPQFELVKNAFELNRENWR